MYEIHILCDKKTADKVGEFLTGPDTFDQTWAPNEKRLVKEAVQDSVNGKRNNRYWYIEKDGEIIAAIGVRENRYGSGGYEMDDDYIAVHKKYRRQGLGQKLLRDVENYVKSRNGRYIHVVTCDIDSYKPARAFYEKNKYKKIGYMPNYYVVGEGRIDYYKEF